NDSKCVASGFVGGGGQAGQLRQHGAASAPTSLATVPRVTAAPPARPPQPLVRHSSMPTFRPCDLCAAQNAPRLPHGLQRFRADHIPPTACDLLLPHTLPSRTLGIPQTATAGDIRAAYLRATLDTHPDRAPPDAPPNQRAERLTAFLRVRAAYDALSDPVERARHDSLLAQRAGRAAANFAGDTHAVVDDVAAAAAAASPNFQAWSTPTGMPPLWE
ncbi:hypothetical protein HK405_000679, partial [Cladochytrium tenue]